MDHKITKTLIATIIINMLLAVYILLFLSSLNLPKEVYLIMFLFVNTMILYVSFFQSKKKYKETGYASHGSSRWQTKKEATKHYSYGKYGFVIGSFSKEKKFDATSKKLLIKSIDDGLNNQFLVIGPPGTYKTTGFILPNIDYLSSREEKPDLIITDPKGEIKRIKESYLESQGYQVYTLDFIDFKDSHCINIFDYINEEEDILKIANQLTSSLYSKENTSGNLEFWKDSLKNVLICIIGYHYYKKREVEISCFSMKDILNSIDIQFLMNQEDYFRKIGGITLESFLVLKNSLGAKETLANILVTVKTKMNLFGLSKLQTMLEKTEIPIHKIGREIRYLSKEEADKKKMQKLELDNIREDIIKNSQSKLKSIENVYKQNLIKELALFDVMTDEILTEDTVENYIERNMLYFNFDLQQKLKALKEDIKIESKFVIQEKEQLMEIVNEKYHQLEKELSGIKNRPIALIIKMRDDDDAYSAVINLILSTLMRTLYETARESGKNGVALRKDVIMLIDEFGLIGHLKELTDKLGGMRGRRIFPIMIIQSIAQLKKVYKDDFQDIISQCDNKLILGVNDTLTGEELVKMLGDETIIVENQSQRKKMFDVGFSGGQIQESQNYSGKKLLNLSELMNLNESQGIFKQKSREPLRFYKTVDMYWEDD